MSIIRPDPGFFPPDFFFYVILDWRKILSGDIAFARQNSFFVGRLYKFRKSVNASILLVIIRKLLASCTGCVKKLYDFYTL
jgi:hypothetical protein